MIGVSNIPKCSFLPFSGIISPFQLTWYYLDSEYGIKNPDGIKFDMGYDFIAATLNGGQLNVSQSATTSTGQAGDAPMSTAAAVGRGHLNPLAWLY